MQANHHVSLSRRRHVMKQALARAEHTGGDVSHGGTLTEHTGGEVSHSDTASMTQYTHFTLYFNL